MDTLGERIAVECPTWATATVLIRDEEGRIVGYGWIDRETGRVVVEREGARLFSESPSSEVK